PRVSFPGRGSDGAKLGHDLARISWQPSKRLSKKSRSCHPADRMRRRPSEKGLQSPNGAQFLSPGQRPGWRKKTEPSPEGAKQSIRRRCVALTGLDAWDM